MTRPRPSALPVSVITLVVALVGATSAAFQSRDTTVTAHGSAVVTGIVVSDEASPRPLGRVTLTLSGADLRGTRMTATDDQGRFLFSGLPAGTFTLTAAKPGYVTTYYGARRAGVGPAVPFTIAEGAPGPPLTVRLLRGAVIAGTVVDQSGRPQPGTRVTVLAVRTLTTGRTLSGVAQNGAAEVTDDRGQYRLWGLRPDSYVVTASPQQGAQNVAIRPITDADLQWAAQQIALGPEAAGPSAGAARAPDPGRPVTYANVFAPGIVDLAGAETITLGPGEVRDGVDVSLQLVNTATISGTVVGLDGQPVPRSSVLLTSAEAAFPGSISSQGRATDANGVFSFAGIAPGSYTASVRASTQALAQPSGRPLPPLPAAAMAGGSTLDLWASLDLTINGEDQTGLVLPLRPGMNVSGRIIFDGTATRPSDVSHVRINLTPMGVSRVAIAVAPKPAAADGTFSLSGVSPGRYRVNANIAPAAPGTAPATSSPWFLASALWSGQDTLDGALEVQPGQDITDLTVVFKDWQTELTGSLVDAANHPALGYHVLLFPTDRTLWVANSRRLRQVTPGPTGQFRVVGLPPGEYYLGAVTDLDNTDLSDPTFLSDVATVALRIPLADGEHKVQDLRLGGG